MDSSQDARTTAATTTQPSLLLAAVFLGLFSLTSLLHTYQALRTRAIILLPFLLGCYCEAAGYVARIAACTYPASSSLPMALSFILSIVGPALMAVTFHIELCYIMCMCGAQKLSIIRPGVLMWLLISLDLVVFLAQLLGSICMTIIHTTSTTTNPGQYISMGGFALQVVVSILTLIVGFVFDMRYSALSRQMRFNERLPWERHLKAVYFASVGLLIRSVVRVVQYGGNVSVLYVNEWPRYAFDAGIVLLVVVAFNWVHPSEVVALLKHRGLICMRLFVFEKPTPPAKFLNLYAPNYVGPEPNFPRSPLQRLRRLTSPLTSQPTSQLPRSPRTPMAQRSPSSPRRPLRTRDGIQAPKTAYSRPHPDLAGPYYEMPAY